MNASKTNINLDKIYLLLTRSIILAMRNEDIV